MHPLTVPVRCHVKRLGALLSLAAALAPALAQQPGPALPPAAAAGRGAVTAPFANLPEDRMYRYAKELNTDFLVPALAVTNARAALAAAALTLPRDENAIAARAADLAKADLALATIKADALGRIQASPDKLTRAQLDALVSTGRYSPPGGLDTGRDPLNFEDHLGYVPIFDGVSLKGWDGNPKFWRVEDGAIVGESSAANPSGNQYIVNREIEAHDFTLKFEVRVEGQAGTGLQYRSKTGIPWLATVPDNVTSNVGPVQLKWMQTGPQADFWPSRGTANTWTGQFYSENTLMRIMAPRGTVVEGFGTARKVVLGTIGENEAVVRAIKPNDWNQYTIVARGGVLIHIINGQVTAVMVDDDPKSSNNWSGNFGIELESTGKVLMRNLWLKKLN